MKPQLKEYAKLQAQIKELEGKRDTIKLEIIDGFHKEGIDKVESDYGRFTIANRTSYTYSEKVKALETKVKLQKIKEEETGVAEARNTEYLVFAPKKD